MDKKVSCRKAFTTTLLQKARENPKIMAITTDSGGSVTLGDFFKALPEQSVELGIAEQNAVAIGAGMSLCGKNVFVCGPACFLAARAYEQVKVDVSYNHTNVKIIGVSGGVSYGPLGGTHTSLHDIAGMRALANLQIFLPADAEQTEFVIKYLTDYDGPAYVRMGRGDVPAVYQMGESFEIGKAKQIYDGKDLTIVSCGETTAHAKSAVEELQKMGKQVRLLDMFTIKPLDGKALIAAAQETGGILVVEEHSENGGLGEAVAHAVAEYQVPVRLMAFPDEEILVGSSSELFHYYHLDAQSILKNALSMIAEVKG